MKTYSNVQDWLKTKPNEKEISKVLDLINKTAKRELKQELWEKERELKKFTKFATEMNELGYKPTLEMTEKAKSITTEIEELKKAIGPIIKRVKKVIQPVVEEIKKEE